VSLCDRKNKKNKKGANIGDKCHKTTQPTSSFQYWGDILFCLFCQIFSFAFFSFVSLSLSLFVSYETITMPIKNKGHNEKRDKKETQNEYNIQKEKISKTHEYKQIVVILPSTTTRSPKKTCLGEKTNTSEFCFFVSFCFLCVSCFCVRSLKNTQKQETFQLADINHSVIIGVSTRADI
jgi:hypothetical protein